MKKIQLLILILVISLVTIGFKNHDKDYLTSFADNDSVMLEDYSDANDTKYTTVKDIKNYTDLVNEVNITEDANLTTAQCRNGIITNYGWNVTAEGDIDVKLAAASSGLKTIFVNRVTHASADYYIKPPDADSQIELDGTLCGNNERVWTENITEGEKIICFTFSINATAHRWACDSIDGAWWDKGS